MLILVKLNLIVLVTASFCFGQQARKIAPSAPIKPTAIVRATPKATPAKAAPLRQTSVVKTSFRALPTKGARVAPARALPGRYRQAAFRAPVRAVRVAYIQNPSNDRYREIQQALADKGYYTAEVTGAWDSASIESLNRFKTDQKLRADGKLCSLSLIALGLGPKYEAVNVEQLPGTSSPTATISTDQR